MKGECDFLDDRVLHYQTERNGRKSFFITSDVKRSEENVKRVVAEHVLATYKEKTQAFHTQNLQDH